MRLPKKRRDETLLLLGQHSEVTRKRKQSPGFETRPKHHHHKKKKSSKSSRMDNSEFAILSGLALHSHSSDRVHHRSRSSSPSSSDEEELENDFAEELWNFQEADRKRLEDLISRNQRCTEFIKRTEQLLRLIRTEQGNIVSQLKLFRKMKRRSRTTTPSPQPPSPSPGPSTEVVVSPEDRMPQNTVMITSTTSPTILSVLTNQQVLSPASPTTTIANLKNTSNKTLPGTPSLLALSSAADISTVTGGTMVGGSGGVGLLGFAPTLRTLNVL